MTAAVPTDLTGPWDALTDLSETYTCYSSALATWAAVLLPSWRELLDPGLHLGLVEMDDLLFGFSHFPPGLAQTLRLVRRSTDAQDEAVAAIAAESKRSHRVIVAGDGFNLPWHVAHARRHVPHWFVVAATGEGPTVVDPFSCRNDLGRQDAALHRIGSDAELAGLARAIPAGDPVHALREAFAFGTDDRDLPTASFRWLVHEDPPSPHALGGHKGPGAIERLAEHFRADGADPRAYRQADDLWSIARHRAYLARRANDDAATRDDECLRAWSRDHAVPLAARWGHVAPLMMQATLSLDAGRTPTASLPDVLSELAEREARAADALDAGGH